MARESQNCETRGEATRMERTGFPRGAAVIGRNLSMLSPCFGQTRRHCGGWDNITDIA
jgi:hypothetical protein